MADVRYAIFDDQENRVPVISDKNKKTTRLLGNNGNIQRTALGVISSQNGNVRVQPSRNAKQGISYDYGVSSKYSQDENSFKQSTRISSSNFPSHVGSISAAVHTLNCTSVISNSSKSSIAEIYRDPELSSAPVSDAPGSDTFSSDETSRLDKNSLQYAATKLDQLKIPHILPTTLPDLEKMTVQCEVAHENPDDMMDFSSPEEKDINESAAIPQNVFSFKQREEQLYDFAEYAREIYIYLRDAERVHRPRINYMDKQTDISPSMRWILVDWLVEVTEEYNLNTETLYLAVSYIDRFLSHMSVKRDKLQLVGTTALFIAAKYEEIYPPDVGQFAYITDNTYKVPHILRMEHLILKVLSFDMGVPTAHMFINKFARTLRCDESTHHLALFIAELSMLEASPFLQFLPSEIAASALAIANFTMGLPAWPSIMTDAYHYTLDDLRECYVNLNRTFSKVTEHAQHAIREKYKLHSKHSVSSRYTALSELPF